MAADLTGIVNEGEFFSQHYLQELLERDLKSMAKDQTELAKTLDQRLKTERRWPEQG